VDEILSINARITICFVLFNNQPNYWMHERVSEVNMRLFGFKASQGFTKGQ